MRIISQDETIDVPYEHTTLIREGTEIYLSSIKLRDTLIAKYSTEEKAVKAMEMCRSRYAWCKIRSHGMNSLTMAMSFRKTDETEQLLKTFAEENIFQFPADEDVE